MPEKVTYTPWFNPPDDTLRTPDAKAASGDRTEVPVYIYDEKTIRAVNVAGVTGRPLLVEGPSGCGKSSLAEHIAQTMDWDYIPATVTSRTQAGDLLYRVDQLKRLRDAQAKDPVGDMRKYIEPGVLWRAFDKHGAESLAPSKASTEHTPFDLPQTGRDFGTVVLLDEIDKADPDVPNNLLLPLGSYRFRVDELGFDVYAQRIPLVILTTNNERKLPDAFLRRCVNLKVSPPDEKRLKDAGRAHYPSADAAKLESIATTLLKGSAGGMVPSTAEYLDTVRACLSLNIDPETPEWTWLTQITAWKLTRRAEG
jgi:MoxR-like ATPase